MADGVWPAVHVRFGRGGIERRVVRLDGPEPGTLDGVGRRCLAVALVPKSAYLIRTLEIPHVGLAETERILRLEIESALPPEFGEPEVSYVELVGDGSAKPGHRRYDVYVTRRGELESGLAELERMGVRPALVLPTAAIWRQVLASAPEMDYLVAIDGSGDGEVAGLNTDETILLRTLPRSAESPAGTKPAGPAAGDSERIGRLVLECVRFGLRSPSRRQQKMSIGWIGAGCPTHWTNGFASFQDLTDRLLRPAGGATAGGEADPLLSLAAYVLGESGTRWCRSKSGVRWQQTADLQPRWRIRRRQLRGLHKALAVGAVGLLLGVVLAAVALRVSVARHEQVGRALDAEMATIRSRGEAIGTRIRQLDAVRSAKATHYDLHDVLTGLYEATPEGITYTQLRLTETGQVELRGEAPSLALPFLLPERLEAQSMFADVISRDAGQVRRGAGTVAEFRVGCRLVRRAAPSRHGSPSGAPSADTTTSAGGTGEGAR
ncbi:MAG TPA: hypothetical protein VM389_11070 [Phycisphaerae bacterium]|nr:hypothetical protein [Phycisphaerae bacterium]